MRTQRTGWVNDLRDGVSASPKALSVAQLLDELSEKLGAGGASESRSVAVDVIAALAGESRSWVALNRSTAVKPTVQDAARAAAKRIVRGEPFAYAVGRAQFRYLDLEIDHRVLIPRPETEMLVEEILSRFRSLGGAATWGLAVDLGTGSGAIALSLAVEGRFERVIATDSSLDALEVAKKNAELASASLKCPVEFRSGSLLSPLRGLKARLLVSNPPYVAFDEAGKLPESVRSWEPPTALYSGSNGLDATAAIVQEGESLLESGGMLALEVDARRASLAAELVMSAGSYIDVSVVLDLTGRERFVFASRA
jgi:release factor glutamine methyltransferase